MSYAKCEDCGSVGRFHYQHCSLGEQPRVEIVEDEHVRTVNDTDMADALGLSFAGMHVGLDLAADPDVKSAIADEAKRIVSGARRSAYGTPEQNFDRIARFWQSYFENTGRGDVKITAADVSPMMRLMKEARLCETPDHRDSFVDLVGYALTGAEVNKVKSTNSA